MNREIKFRAWNEVREKMLNWYEFLDTNMKDTFIAPESTGLILIQSTGLKDKNGVEIYEGDIIGYTDWEEKMRVDGVVKYGEFNCSCCEGVYGWYIDGGDIRNIKSCEVIGNVWENGELLDDSK